MPDPEKRYWDSGVFIAIIKNEPGRADICESILNDARAGRCLIYTSMLTLTEVVKRRKGETPIDRATRDTIAAFFRHEYIKLIPVDHLIAERARNLIWDFPWLGARDAIHVATAIQLGVPFIEHYDDDDIGKVGQRVAQDGLTGFPEIRNPLWVGQTEMRLDQPMAAPDPAANREIIHIEIPPGPALPPGP